MSDSIDNIIIEHLKALRASNDRIEFEVKEVKARVTHLEAAVIGTRRDTVNAQDDIYRQQTVIDKITDRIDKIEKLLTNVAA